MDKIIINQDEFLVTIFLSLTLTTAYYLGITLEGKRIVYEYIRDTGKCEFLLDLDSATPPADVLPKEIVEALVFLGYLK